MQAAVELELSEFLAIHQGVYMIGVFPPVEEKDGSEWSFVTTSLHGEKVRRPELEVGGERVGGGLVFLRKLEKTDRNPWSRQLSLGRAANNDIQLRHFSVSKLHAFCTSEAGVFEVGAPPAGQLFLEDAGSSNATRVGERVLTPGEPVPIGVGDLLRFGDVRGELIATDTLYRKLRSY